MLSQKAKTNTDMDMTQFVEEEIKALVRTSPLNRMTDLDNQAIFDEPLVQFADGDDPIFTEYKTIIDPTHCTPREALAKGFNKSPEDMPDRLSVISWILPFTSKVRESNRRHTLTPSHYWAHGTVYGEEFNKAVRRHTVKLLTEMGYMAVAPTLLPYFLSPGGRDLPDEPSARKYALLAGGFGMEFSKEKGFFSKWSERHIAYAAGLGTFSLSDGFITERGISHRCGSIVTSLVLPASLRTAKSPYSNCLFYTNGKCRACIDRCPAGAVTESGHNKIVCRGYEIYVDKLLAGKYNVFRVGCGLCQTKVPCEFRNPAESRKKEKATPSG